IVGGPHRISNAAPVNSPFGFSLSDWRVIRPEHTARTVLLLQEGRESNSKHRIFPASPAILALYPLTVYWSEPVTSSAPDCGRSNLARTGGSLWMLRSTCPARPGACRDRQ